MTVGKGSYRLQELSPAAQKREVARLRKMTAAIHSQPFWKTHGLRVSSNVIDLGSGTGQVAVKLAQTARRGEVLGIDYSDRLLRTARQAAKRAGVTNIRFRKMDLLQPKLPENWADFVLARYTVQHLPNVPMLLAYLLRVLRPGGSFVVEDIDRDLWFPVPCPAEWAWIRRERMKIHASRGGNLRIGTELAPMMVRAGFVNVGLNCEMIGERLTSRQPGETDILFFEENRRAAVSAALDRLVARAQKNGTFFYRNWFTIWGERPA